jgi:chemotaxis protein CheX
MRSLGELGAFIVSSVSDFEIKSAGEMLQLEPILDLGAAERLHAQLVSLRGRPLDIDASQVERLGGLCLQVLLSAKTTWATDGQDVRLSSASPAFEDAWALFGAPAFSSSHTDNQGPDA